MSFSIKTGLTNKILVFSAFNSVTGLAKTDLLAADIDSATMKGERIGLTQTSISSPTDKTNPDDTHADGAIYNMGGGDYAVDTPDAAVGTQCEGVKVIGTWTDGSDVGYLSGVWLPLTAYDAAAALDSNVTELNGDATAASHLAVSCLGLVISTSKAGTLTNTLMSTNLTEAPADHYIGKGIVWTNGVLTYDALAQSEVPGSSDQFVLF